MVCAYKRLDNLSTAELQELINALDRLTTAHEDAMRSIADQSNNAVKAISGLERVYAAALAIKGTYTPASVLLGEAKVDGIKKTGLLEVANSRLVDTIMPHRRHRMLRRKTRK